MGFKWIEKVRKNKKLIINPTPGVQNGTWGPIFISAVDEFNKLSAKMGLGVVFEVDKTNPPSETTLGGADVSFDAASGPVQVKALGIESTVSLPNDMHGATRTYKGGDPLQIMKAFVVVPQQPMVQFGPAGNQKIRPAGDGIRLFIAIHELVHACGLDDKDHSPERVPDFFIGQPQPSPGSTPDQDRLRLFLNPPNNVFAPPLLLSTRTAGLIKSLWV